MTVKVNVARSPEEADLQAQGVDVMAQMFEDEAAPAAEELAPEAVELRPLPPRRGCGCRGRSRSEPTETAEDEQ